MIWVWGHNQYPTLLLISCRFFNKLIQGVPINRIKLKDIPLYIKWHKHCANYAIYINPNRIQMIIFEFEVSMDFSKIIKINYKTGSNNTWFFCFLPLFTSWLRRSIGCLQPPHLVPTFCLIFWTCHIHHVPRSTLLRTHIGCRFLEGLPPGPYSWFNCRWDSWFFIFLHLTFRRAS